MGTATLKKKCLKAIDLIDDNDFLLAVYTLLDQKTREYSSVMTESQKSELDKAIARRKSGKAKLYSVNQAKTLVFGKSK